MNPEPAVPDSGHAETAPLPPPLYVIGVGIHPVSAADLIRIIIAWGDGQLQRRVFHVNVHAMNLAAHDEAFLAALRRADLVFCDGYGVKWGARLAGLRIPYRMTSPDWIDDFAAWTAAAGQSVFAIGDEEGVAEAFQRMLASRHPGYRVAGSHHGFFSKEGPENDAVIDAINRSGAHHLLVGFGMPLQELWLERNAARLKPRVLIPVGALFRWYTETDRRAPAWMTDYGMEWLARFVRHPLRHFRRYAVGNPAFLLRVLRWRFGSYQASDESSP
jgi:N-acetylglucosaminyldiphosphoundecaprenol N-acetyl-beta-D-mannosaminyltransferase